MTPAAGTQGGDADRARLDRDAIFDVINAYFFALDSRDFSGIDRIFTDNAEYVARLADGAIYDYHGRSAIADALRNVGAFRTSHHTLSNYGIAIDGNRARATVHALDALWDESSPSGPQLIQHGLRYVDTLECRAEGWQISRRELTCLWQKITEAPAFKTGAIS